MFGRSSPSALPPKRHAEWDDGGGKKGFRPTRPPLPSISLYQECHRGYSLFRTSGQSLRKARPDGSGRGLQCKLEAWRILNGMDVQKFWRATAARFKMPVRLGAFLLLGRTAANFEPNLTHFQPKTKEERQQLCYVRHVLTAKYIRPYFFGVA